MTDASFDAPTPPAGPTLRQWVQHNIIRSPLHIAISTASIALAAWIGYHVVNWAVLDATFRGGSRDDCTSGGACWPFVAARFNQFIYGFYPREEQWRVNVAGLVLIASAGLILTPGFAFRRLVGLFLVLVFPFLAYLLLHGGLWLPVVSTSRWGGLTLTLTIALFAIAVSLPLGTGLALCRRSRLPVVSMLAVVFIETMRAVPLISVLFMASVLLPLFLPPEVTIDKLVRALVGIALFASAYIAEVVRGGLQAVPPGQAEAARSLGLSRWHVQAFIVLPQALRIAIPGIVNTFIGIFKDTALVIVIGLFDLLGMINAAVNDTRWTGMELEGYVFAAVIYWCFCYAMSHFSREVEKRTRYGH